MAELHQELKQYLTNGGMFPMIRHPLVYSVPYFGDVENERLNERLEIKRAEVEAAEAAGDWERVVFLHERPYRYDALRNLRDDMPADAYVALLQEVWVDSENVWQNIAEWKRDLLPLAGKDVWNTMADLPERMKVYRGGGKNGISWTLDKGKAEWFASRLSAGHPVWEAEIEKAHVIGHLVDRGENEILLDPRRLIGCKRIDER